MQVEMRRLQATALGYSLIPCSMDILCSFSVAFFALRMTSFIDFECWSSSLSGNWRGLSVEPMWSPTFSSLFESIKTTVPDVDGFEMRDTWARTKCSY